MRSRLAILGTRGIPASYGRFETFAQELAPRLVARGHDVTVYCRAQYVDPALREFHGVHLQQAPTIRHKYLDTVVHTAASTLHAMRRRYDAILVCNAANAIFCVWPRLVGTRVVLNVDQSSPTVAIAVTYDVGSRDEVPGRSGFAHLFEHMMFQGSKNVGKGDHFTLITARGGTLNGTTSVSRTSTDRS